MLGVGGPCAVSLQRGYNKLMPINHLFEEISLLVGYTVAPWSPQMPEMSVEHFKTLTTSKIDPAHPINEVFVVSVPHRGCTG